jgi:hypothetical protein
MTSFRAVMMAILALLAGGSLYELGHKLGFRSNLISDTYVRERENPGLLLESRFCYIFIFIGHKCNKRTVYYPISPGYGGSRLFATRCISIIS